MKKILYVSLDERPCNYNFPTMIADSTDIEMIYPPIELLGVKKKPANTNKLWDWVFENVDKADGAILSIDMLLYGGIVPSRLHSLSIEECEQRLENITKLKSIKPDLKIFAFNLIMRCPSYSSSEEEPDYYEDYGRLIFRTGYINHKKDLGIAEDEEIKELKDINKKLPKHILNDYVGRRKINREVNRRVIDYVKKGFIDFLVIPQDDSSPYGYTAIDQQYVRESISKNGLNFKIYMYPGADEVGCTLLARMINEDKNICPKVYVRYSSTKGPFLIPLYEDRILNESVKYQVTCAGGQICSSLSEADIVLAINCPGGQMMEAMEEDKRDRGYNVDRNIVEFVNYIDYVVNEVKKPCIVGDVAFTNGGDLELVGLMRQKKLLFKVAAYAGWNTSSNTLGTCIAQGMLYSIYGSNQSHKDFLALRYVEDVGHCSFERQLVANEILPGMGFSDFNIDGQRGKVSKIVMEELIKFTEENLNYDNYHINITDCYMPWSRMFEVGLKVNLVENTDGLK
jgi:hypothetical protein